MKNAYVILGVSENSSIDEIRQAYVMRTRVVHPDRFEPGSVDWQNASNMLRELNEAYAFLRNHHPQKEPQPPPPSPSRQQTTTAAGQSQAGPSSQRSDHKDFWDDLRQGNQGQAYYQQKVKKAKRSSQVKKLIGALILFLFFVGPTWFSPSTPETQVPTIPPVTLPPEQPTPKSGTYWNVTGGDEIAPFTIKTSGSGYYFVKLVGTDHVGIIKFFIHAGDTIEFDVPLGVYKMRYASGERWYGEDGLFGPNTVCSASDSTFDFRITNNQIMGYTVTLYKVSGGNMYTHNIPRSEF